MYPGELLFPPIIPVHIVHHIQCHFKVLCGAINGSGVLCSVINGSEVLCSAINGSQPLVDGCCSDQIWG